MWLKFVAVRGNDVKMLFVKSLNCSCVLFEKCISWLLLLSAGGIHSRFIEAPLTFSPLGTRDMKVNAELLFLLLCGALGGEGRGGKLDN